MSFSDNDAFPPGFDSFLLASSSPPLPADPPPADTTWTPSITEQPSTDGIFSSMGLYGEGLDLLQDYSDNVGFVDIEQISLVDTEQMTLDLPDHEEAEFHIPTALDTGIAGPFFPSSDYVSRGVPVVEHSMADEQTELSCPLSKAGGLTNNNMERQTDAEPMPQNTNHFNYSFTQDRIDNLEAKITELLDWKAQQMKRGTELKRMMDEILELLQEQEKRLDMVK